MKLRFSVNVWLFTCSLFLLMMPVSAAPRQVMRGHVPAVVAGLKPTGNFPGTNRLNLAIGLPLRNKAALTNLLRQIYDPASPKYHHYLTPEQFTRMFGPTEKDYAAVVAFAKANGLQVTGTHPNRMLVDVSGSVANIEKAMHVTMRLYQHPKEARQFYAPDVEPSLGLTVPILSIGGLDNYSLPSPRLVARPLVNGQSVAPNAGSGPSGSYMGGDFRAAYAPGVTLNGTGQTVGLLQFDGYTASDITYYESQAGLPSVTLSNVLIDGASGNPSGSGGEVEVSLDIEMAISMAPGLSKVMVYMAPNPSPWEDLLNRMATDNLAKQLSCSWYQPGGAAKPTCDQIFQQMAAQGQSFFNASGDYDAYTGLIDFPGDTPYLTQAGGTTLSTTGPGGVWTSETVWNRGNGIGSGGGISTQYPIPSWQTNINMTANQGSTTKRNTPDVALTAENVYVRANGVNYTVGGTSCAAPLWAGFAALINQQAVNNGEATVGFITPAICSIGLGGSYASAFHDITTGNNTSGSSPSKFYAVTGYDLCTGWGTPSGQSLVDALVGPPAPTPPTIITQPQSRTNVSGSSAVFGVTAAGSFPLSYQWRFNGTNIAGATNPVLTLANVQPTNTGIYAVEVTNLYGSKISSNAVLTVLTLPPTITLQPSNRAVYVGFEASFSVMVTGSLPLSYQWSFGGTNMVGATNTTLTLTNVQLSQAGNYAVTVTNLYGSAVSSNAVLTVNPRPPCAPASAGLVGWWPGEGNANDIAGTNNGTLVNAVGFVPGEVGQAFSFDGVSSYISIPNSPSLNSCVSSITVETWIRMNQLTPYWDWQGIVTKGNSSWRLQVTAGANTVSFSATGVSNADLYGSRNVYDGQWHHVAGVYDGTNIFLYVDGTLDVSQPATGSISQNSYPVCIGENAHAPGKFLRGMIDEASTYNRALTASEIQTIYAAGAGGKCHVPTPPVISIQPANQTVYVGFTANFSVTATGSLPLSYQWSFGGTNIAGATNISLTLTNAQLNQAGNYAVWVTNAYGSVLSSNAVLTVNLPSSCAPVSSGLVGWWPGEGNGNDVVGTNNGTLVNGAGFAPGEVGQAFSFDGVSSYVSIPDSPSLDTFVSSITVETWIKMNQLTAYWNWEGIVTKGNSSWRLQVTAGAKTVTFSATGVSPHGDLYGSRSVYDGQWHHVAGVYDGTNMFLYVDGTLDVSQPAMGSISQNSYPVCIGENAEAPGLLFKGMIDEVSIYKRALTASEIQLIYATGSGGKCPLTSPAIISQPTNQTVTVGGTATFNVTASGTPPLRCQWAFNGTNMVGATNTTLTLTNVQLAQAGSLAVLVTNAYGSVLSSNAVLTVNPASPGVPVITGFNPISGVVGTNVTIFGTNFSPVASNDIVYFGAVQATIIAASTTVLTVTVPAGATYAPLTVTVNGLVAYSGTSFMPTFAGNGTAIGPSTFGPRLDMNSPSGPIHTAIGDLDGDGKPDLVVGSAYDHMISIFQNLSTNGPLTTNSFATRVDLPSIGGTDNPFGLLAADVDGDGKLDLVECDRANNQILVYRNLSTGGMLTTNSFAAPVAFEVGADPRYVQVVDLDGDGRPDMICGSSAANAVSILQNIGVAGSLTTHSFAAHVDLPAGTGAYDVAVGDLDGDGKPDLAVVNSGDLSVSIYRNRITGLGVIDTNSFAPQIQLPAPDSTLTIAIGDVDGDGKPDVVIGSWGGQSMSVYRNLASPGSLSTNSFASRIDFGTTGSTHNVALGDLNGDAKPDIALVAEESSAMSVFQNLSTPGSFTNSSLADRVDYATGWNAWGVSVGDLDGDGRPDVVFGNCYDNTISIYQNATPFAGEPPIIMTQPTNQTVMVGNPASFGVTASGATPLSYQWSFNGTNIWGATNTTLTLTNVQASQAGNYAVLATNLYGSALSSNAVLTVNLPTPCTPAPANVAAWWPAEGHANDIVGTNHGVLVGGMSYGAGKVGQAFFSNSTNGPGVRIPASPGLNVGASNGFTLEAWINPTDVARSGPIFEWNLGDGTTYWGVHFHIDPFSFSAGPGALYANIVPASGGWNQIHTAGGAVTNNGFQHVALTYDKTTGVATIYRNGVIMAQQNFGVFTPQTTYDLYLGRRPLGHDGPAETYSFLGSIDEPAIYNRALSSNEIAAIYIAGTGGKCSVPTPPAITTQPVSQTVPVNGTATFSVTADGTGPLGYFWRRGGAPIPGANGASYSLTNAQLSDSGSKFSCLVTNVAGSAISSNALLKVIDTVANDQCGGAIIITSASYTNVQSTLKASSFGDPVPDCITDFGHGVWYQFTAPVAGLLLVDTFGSDFDTGLAIYTGSCDALTELACNDDTGGVTSQVIMPTTAGATYSILAGGYSSDAGNLVLHLNHLTPPVFTVQPTNQSVVVSSNASFTTTVSGTQPVGFQWYFNNTPLVDGGRISGSTNTTLNIASIQTNDAGNYQLVASNIVGVATSSVASLTAIILPPVIIQQPVDQSVLVGSNVTFTAVVDGTPPYSYQWYFNGSALSDDARISGSTTAALSISNITTADAGSYALTVTNVSGSTNSAAAVLTVLVPPTITTQPIGRSVPPGLPTTFTAAASGNPAPACQWQLNGTNIPGATSSSCFIAAVGTNDLGFYHLVASNAVGVVVSADAQLTFGPVAAWGRNLSNESLPPPGLSNVFAVAGNFGASFAVRTDGTIAAWGSGSVTNIPASATNVVAIAAPGNYALRSDGTVVSWNGIPAPALSNIVSVAAGFNFGCALRAEGTVTNWGGILTPGFPAGLNHLTAIAAGYNNALALRSDGTIAVAGGGVVTNIPSGLSNVVAIAAGYTYAMALKADGTVVAWGSGTGTNLPAGMTNIVAIAAGNNYENSGLAIRSNGTVVAWGDSFYGEKIPPAALSNLISIAVSTPAYHGLALVNDGSPVILHPPVGLTAYTGRDVTLHGDAAGAQPLSYQWLMNGTNIPGATSTSLVISNVQFSNAGNYQLSVSNSINTALSLAAPLTVISNNALVFLSVPASQTNYQGGKISLGVTVLGSGPLRYQWFFSVTNKNYATVSGATNDTLVLDPALAVNTGNYYVAVSNQFNFITNTPVNVRVLFARAWGFQAVSNPPVNVTNAIAIATGGYQNYYGHYFALGSDGKLTSWANYYASYGETNVSALSNSTVIAIAAGSQSSLALRSDGTVYAWGYGNYGQTNPPSGLNNVVAIACGDYHDLALKSDGTVIAWGQNLYGEGTNSLVATNAAVAIAAGTSHNLGLRADGTVFGWGYNSYGQTTIPTAATNVIAIAAGQYHSLALRANGTVVGWGNNGNGQVSIPAGLSNVVAISASSSHSTMLRADGTVVSLGYEYIGLASNNVPPDLANVIAISSGGDHDFGLLGTRAPAFTVQPWNRTIPLNARTNITLAAKCAGVQPVRYQWQLNGTNLPSATNDTLILTNQPLVGAPIHLIPTGAYQLIASNAYGVVASKYAKLTMIIPLADALDTPTDGKGISLYNWTTSGNAPWYGQTNVTHDGVDAARSGDIGNNQETILQTTLVTNWSGRCTFWWKVSSEEYFDTLEFRVNGVVQTNISGEVDWQQCSIPVPAGTNTLQWRYSKDATYGSGQDAGWVDQFVFKVDPPVITAQPTNLAVSWGTTAQFRVTATGYPTLAYRWWKNGTIPVGNNTSILTLTGVQDADAASYTVVVTNMGGSVTSSPAVLTVIDWPIITTQPASHTNMAGTATTFSVVAGGKPPFGYQWRKNGADMTDGGNVSGSTTTSLVLTNVQDADAAGYSVVVTNDTGSVTSSPAMLTVLGAAPVITSQPSSCTNLGGTMATFSVAVTGSMPFSYQWQFNGTNLDGATNSSLTLDSVRPRNAGTYRAVVTNAVGSAISSNATLTVTRSRVIAWGDNSMGQTNVPPGLTDVMAVAGGDNHSLALQHNGQVVAWGYNWYGQTNVPAYLANVTAIAGGYGRSLALQTNGTVVVWGYNDYGLTNVPPDLTNVVAIAGGSLHNLALRADGTIVAWGNNSSGETNVPAGLTNITAIAAGYYHSLALQTGGTVVGWGPGTVGPVRSVPVNLTDVVAVAGGSDYSLALKSDTTLVAWGDNYSGQTNVPVGLSNVVAIAAGASHAMALQSDGTVVAWGYNVSGQTNVPFGLSNVVAIAGGGNHSLAIQNDGSPVIVRQTGNQTTLTNTTVVFSVTALGQSPLSYQWQKNGSNLTDDGNVSGSTTATLTLTNVQASDIAIYTVAITNDIDRVTSSPAMLTVIGPPIIAVQPASQTVNLGISAQFNVTAVGNPLPAYQWLWNGTNPVGINSSSLTLTGLCRAHNGVYSVLVTNSFGSVLSSNATLKVLVPQKLGTPALLPDGTWQLNSGDADGGLLSASDLANFEARVSTNLTDWVTLTNGLSLTNGMLRLQDPGSTNDPMRFYRILEH